MARPLRVEIPEAWYHVTSRANRREALFRTDEDRRGFLARVSELEGRFGVEVHAFVLMSNHYHLVLKTRRANLSQAIQWLNLSYGTRFNWNHKTCGHVFQGRFHSVLIENETGVVEVVRYVHLNPVRVAKLGLGKGDQHRSRAAKRQDVSREEVAERLQVLKDYWWSSWRVYSGAEPTPKWLRTELIAVACGGRSKTERRKTLCEFTKEPIREGILESPWDRLVGGIVLGSHEFALGLAKQVGGDPSQQTASRRLKRERAVTWENMVTLAKEIRGRKWEELLEAHGDWTRDAVLSVAVREGGLRLPEVLRRIPGLSYNAAAQAIRRVRERSKGDRHLAQFMGSLEARVVQSGHQMSKV